MELVPEEILLVDNSYLLQKYPGKGGWTFASIPEIKQDKHAWFGWVKVKGSIDGYEISNYHLMPLGNGTLFLPVKAEIRKKIGKQEGDWVHIVLYSQDLPPVLPADFEICLKDDSKAYENFLKLSTIEQKQLTEWIFSAKNDSVKIERIVFALNKLSK